MYDPKLPEEFNFDRVTPEEEKAESVNILEKAKAENLSVKNVALHQQQLQRIFFWLIGIGLGFGVILSIVVVFALNKFGLAKKPYEREHQPRQEQIQNERLENLNIQQQ
jgi:hypothetical protein